MKETPVENSIAEHLQKIADSFIVDNDISLYRAYPHISLEGPALYYDISHRGAAVGKVGFYSMIAATASMSYGLQETAEGKGIATKAAMYLRDIGFDCLELNNINLSIAKNNRRSQAVARRLGAVLTVFSPNPNGLDKWTIMKGSQGNA